MDFSAVVNVADAFTLFVCILIGLVMQPNIQLRARRRREAQPNPRHHLCVSCNRQATPPRSQPTRSTRTSVGCLFVLCAGAFTHLQSVLVCWAAYPLSMSPLHVHASLSFCLVFIVACVYMNRRAGSHRRKGAAGAHGRAVEARHSQYSDGKQHAGAGA